MGWLRQRSALKAAALGERKDRGVPSTLCRLRLRTAVYPQPSAASDSGDAGKQQWKTGGGVGNDVSIE
jgi:hypothetical protein